MTRVKYHPITALVSDQLARHYRLKSLEGDLIFCMFQQFLQELMRMEMKSLLVSYMTGLIILFSFSGKLTVSSLLSSGMGFIFQVSQTFL